jgi:hypothetical protein
VLWWLLSYNQMTMTSRLSFTPHTARHIADLKQWLAISSARFEPSILGLKPCQVRIRQLKPMQLMLMICCMPVVFDAAAAVNPVAAAVPPACALGHDQSSHGHWLPHSTRSTGSKGQAAVALPTHEVLQACNSTAALAPLVLTPGVALLLQSR